MKLRYVQASKVRSYMKEQGLRTGHSFLEALDREVLVLLEKYKNMAKNDRRKTVLAIDIELPGVIAKLSQGIRR